jgi:hypothetical protein
VKPAVSHSLVRTYRWLRLQFIRNTVIVSLLLLFGLYLVFLWSLPAPVTLTTISGVTEHIQFTVTDRRLGTIPTAGMRIATNANGSCLPASIVPDINAVVSYRRILTDRLIVSIEKGGAVIPEDGEAPSGRITGPIDFVTDALCQKKHESEIKCDESIKGSCSQHRLPVWGRVSLGHESALLGPQGGGTFLEGTLKVQARALSIGDASMYSVFDMTLPVGARIEARGLRPTIRTTGHRHGGALATSIRRSQGCKLRSQLKRLPSRYSGHFRQHRI